MGREHIFGRGYAARRARAGSAIPRVVGILMIVFGALALLGGTVGVIGTCGLPGLAGMMTLLVVSNLVGLAIAALELAAGIALVRHRAKGLALAQAYALFNIVTTLASAILSFVFVGPAMVRAGLGDLYTPGITIALAVASLVWPIIVLALVTRPAAALACAPR